MTTPYCTKQKLKIPQNSVQESYFDYIDRLTKKQFD